jgi:hypothetical protein
MVLNTEWKNKLTVNGCLILIFNTKQKCTSQKIYQEGPSYKVFHLSCLLQSCNLQMNKTHLLLHVVSTNHNKQNSRCVSTNHKRQFFFYGRTNHNFFYGSTIIDHKKIFFSMEGQITIFSMEAQSPITRDNFFLWNDRL